MKNFLKEEKGISLLSLAATIIVIGIITTMLLYSIGDTKDVQDLTNLYSDIDNLTGKISNYYSEYGNIPAKVKLEAEVVNEFKNAQDSPVGENDTGDFLLIDLSAIENLTLNYGRDFEKVKGLNSIGDYRDLYIINANSHNVFYLKGIEVDGKKYYTNQDKDTEKVDLRYVDGIKIFDGYDYKSGDKRTGVVITDGTNDYTWQDVVGGQVSISEAEVTNGTEVEEVLKVGDTTLTFNDDQNRWDFQNSVDNFGGFYLKSNGQVLYFSTEPDVDSNWSKTYTTEGFYRDENGDTAYIPAGFKVSKLPTMNKIKSGLVIQNATTKDEYVWIDVPDSVLQNANTLEEIENALKGYASDYREEGYEDTWYDGCGILYETDYNELKNKMYLSIKDNGGFYIGRYEAGTNTAITSGSASTPVADIITANGTPLSQKDKYPYYCITVGQAQQLAYSENSGKYTTSLMFGIQWDLVCKFIEDSGAKTKDEIKTDSTKWGNFVVSNFNITSNNAYKRQSTWAKIDIGTLKVQNVATELTTGSSNTNSVLNLFDFAGNYYEYTLEKKIDTVAPTARGGSCWGGGGTTVTYRSKNTTVSSAGASILFRKTLFK